MAKYEPCMKIKSLMMARRLLFFCNRSRNLEMLSRNLIFHRLQSRASPRTLSLRCVVSTDTLFWVNQRMFTTRSQIAIEKQAMRRTLIMVGTLSMTKFSASRAHQAYALFAAVCQMGDYRTSKPAGLVYPLAVLESHATPGMFKLWQKHQISSRQG